MFNWKYIPGWQTWWSYLNFTAFTLPITYYKYQRSKSLMLTLAASVHDYQCESGSVIRTAICVDLVDLRLPGWPMLGILLVAVVLIWGPVQRQGKYAVSVSSTGIVPVHRRGDWRGLPVSLQTHRCMHSDLPERPAEYVRGIDCASRPMRCKIQEMQAVWWLSPV